MKNKKRLWVSVLAKSKPLLEQDEFQIIGAINNKKDERIGHITEVRVKNLAGNWVETSRMEGIWQIREIFEINFIPGFPGRVSSLKVRQNTSLEVVLLCTQNLNIKDIVKSGIFKA